jgi:cellulose synthase/poly-beta-1,6-N-acetylglucosamine synthase-like glycosyltransferase
LAGELKSLATQARVKAQESAVIAAVTIVISIALILRSVEFSGIVFPVFEKAVQCLTTMIRFDFSLVFRYQDELLQNLPGRILTKGEWMPIEMRPRSSSIGPRLKYIFVAALTDVSVIIPTWNEERYLPRCLQSLAHQNSKTSLEVIVVDGGSTDRTVEIAEQRADRVLVEDGKPAGAARNIGAHDAKGKILAFIDADTLASEHWMSEIAQTLRGRSGVVGVTGPTLPYEGTKLDELAYRVATGWAQRLSLKLGFPHVAGFNCAYQKEAFWEAGGFDENRQLSEDVMLSLRIRHRGRILYNPQMVAYTSLRRIKKYGYPYLTTYYMINAGTMLLFRRSLAYPKVR